MPELTPAIEVDLFVSHALAFISYICIRFINSPEPRTLPELEALRSTLILAVKGLYDQGHNHHLAKALFHVIRGEMRPQEASLLTGSVVEIREKSDDKPQLQAIHSRWPVSIVNIADDVESHVLTNLVERYASS